MKDSRQIVIDAIKSYRNENGQVASLAKKAKLNQSWFTRFLEGEIATPSVDTLIKLYQASPKHFSTVKEVLPDVLTQHGKDNADILPNGEERSIPVFDAGAGDNCDWSDQGYPLGRANTYIKASARDTDENSFAVKVHGNSMSPKIEDCDIAIIVPSLPLEHGRPCFVTEIGSDIGLRIIRRYFKYENTIVLKPDNPSEGFEIVITSENARKYNLYMVAGVHKSRKNL